MKLKKLLDGIDSRSEFLPEDEIKGIKTHSAKVQKGDVFIALSGQNFDGCDYAKDALKNGAKYIITQKDLGLENQILVDSARSAYAKICKNFYEKACEKLKIIAITGTNGKTTTTHLLGSMLSRLGCKVGTIGTLGAKFGGKTIETNLTTPDPEILHSLFKQMVDEKVEYVVMEASAHALALNKLDGIKFQAAVLTNITQDHLDFFGDMDNYAKAKFSLFDKSRTGIGIVCADDPRARNIIPELNNFARTNIPIISYGLDTPSDVFAIDEREEFGKSYFTVNCLDDVATASSNLIGKYNLQNILAALSVCCVLGFDLNDSVKALSTVEPPEGRFNVINMDNFKVVIDYAHTPDGLENLLTAVREITPGKVITLFGCGGNRDKLKRPIMGQVASRLSDKVIITTDNPRFEKPLDIIKDILVGVKGGYQVYPDRISAINNALFDCQEGDTLVIAGKGAENYQEIMGKKIRYSDFEQVYNHYLRRINKNDERKVFAHETEIDKG